MCLLLFMAHSIPDQIAWLTRFVQLQPGDIILGVNGKPVTSVQQLRGAVKSQQSTVALLVERGDAQIFIPIRAAPGEKNGP